MRVALLFISHRHMASHLPTRTESLHAERMGNCAIIEVPLDTSVNDVLAATRQQSDPLQMADGLKIITEMFDGTPSNTAHTLA